MFDNYDNWKLACCGLYPNCNPCPYAMDDDDEYDCNYEEDDEDEFFD